MTKLLVVDDNSQNRYMAEVLFKGNGYQVESAVDGVEALEKARGNPPDMIVSDILMPGMDGFALCREWKQDDRLRSIPFIFYTATYTDPEDEKFALSLGADRFFVKPYAPEDLVAAIEEVLREFRDCSPAFPVNPGPEEDVYLKKYNQALVHKLEDKLAQLENANQSLEKEIRERKLAEERMHRLESQLIQSQKMEAIGTLASGIAHDFNNILLAIMGYSEIALINNQAGKSDAKHTREALKACERAKELVHQILTFGRQTDIDRKPVQIRTVVKEVLKLLRASLPATIEIRQKLESESLILADPTQIYQVVMNLGNNAAQAMKERAGAIDVTLVDVELDETYVFSHHGLTPGRYQKLEVSDTGVGITPDHLKRIFEPYFTTKPRGEGTGLGLSVVHGIVKNSDGTISVYSEPDQGSTFKVFFPIFESDAIAEAPPVELPEGGKESILFVDDEPTLLEIGAELLKRLGYRVATCGNGRAALKTFKSRPNEFDLVITDMTMPGLTGDKLAEELLRVRPDLPVILCTGFGNAVMGKKACRTGVKAHLMKPFVLRDLAKTIRQVLEDESA
jgi:CheY-like chemotaxis protein/nitrogen-specific signal transduction histidine kinase